ncbi:hypothetical protein BX600DRAFT_437160 [Xylariales sp. PMI_506]|nr:hypothetical protein BX600DRAFT_437160 [Xylariales sp. PMI_506]
MTAIKSSRSSVLPTAFYLTRPFSEETTSDQESTMMVLCGSVQEIYLTVNTPASEELESFRAVKQELIKNSVLHFFVPDKSFTNPDLIIDPVNPTNQPNPDAIVDPVSHPNPLNPLNPPNPPDTLPPLNAPNQSNVQAANPPDEQQEDRTMDRKLDQLAEQYEEWGNIGPDLKRAARTALYTKKGVSLHFLDDNEIVVNYVALEGNEWRNLGYLAHLSEPVYMTMWPLPTCYAKQPEFDAMTIGKSVELDYNLSEAS